MNLAVVHSAPARFPDRIQAGFVRRVRRPREGHKCTCVAVSARSAQSPDMRVGVSPFGDMSFRRTGDSQRTLEVSVL